MKDFWTASQMETRPKKLNKKKVITLIVIVISICLIVTAIVVYTTNKFARDWIDKNILRKEVMQDNVTTIELKDEQHSNIYAFNKYIGILNKNKFTIYGNTGNIEKELEIQITNPIFNSSNRFLAIAETKGQKVYVIEDKENIWETNVEGNISQVHINKNGYVAVVIVDTSYKTIIAMYNPEGEELFKTYLSSTRTVDASISNDNKYLAIAEVDTSGTIIQSNVKVISIEKASSEPTNSVENTYKGENGKLLVNIKYQDKNKLVCMYTDCIHMIEDGQNKVLCDNREKKMIFQSIELDDYAVSIEEKSSGLFTADSLVKNINITNRNTHEYIVDSVTKEMYSNGNIIALNLGTEVEFINTSGWLVKRYVANQEITKVVVSSNLAGIIYRDKIEIINL